MKTQHTPGPWQVDPEPYCEGGYYIQNSTGALCIASTPEELPESRDEEQLANAHLIASAPELAEALRELLKSAEYAAGALDAPEQSTFLENIANAHQALSKAFPHS